MNPSFELATRSLISGAGATLTIYAWAAVLWRFGVVTVLCPWFVLQPAIGAGIASSKTRNPVRNALKSLLTHTVFGIRLFLAAHATAPLLVGGNRPLAEE